MNNNQSKQVLMSVIGVAILVIAVVGVSFAFFTYTRTGAQNNVITAGKVTFVFQDSTFIALTDQFPTLDSTGVALTGTGNTCAFSVTGNTVSGSTISFAVWAVDGDTSSQTVLGANYANYTTKFQNSEIKVHIESTDVANTTFTRNAGMSASAGVLVSALPTTASNGAATPVASQSHLLGEGTISGTGSDITRNFTVRMWVSSAVTICSTGSSSCTYTEDQYDNLYYTMKIAVTAVQ